MNTAPIFSNNMVLQRNKPVRIFGTCKDSTENIKVSIPEMNVSAEAVIKNDKWTAVLPPMKECDCCTVEILSENEKIVFVNVAVGEVWLAGGQSNMEFELHSDKNGMQELELCSNENIRYYYTPKCEMCDQNLIEKEKNSGWCMPSEQNSWAWSAVAYYFAKELSRKLGVTVGILGCNWGGTSASAWIPQEYLKSNTNLLPYIEDYQKAVEGKTDEQMIKEYDDYLVYHADWERKMQKCYAENPDIKWEKVLEICGENRYPGPMGIKNPMRPCGLYDTMVKRVSPYTVKGVLWYQGESDDHRPDTYYELMLALIKCWRREWHDDELAFLIVQLPMFKYESDPDYKHWCIIREAQMKVFRTVKNTGIAISLECGEFNNIHPAEKSVIGHRLYLQAMSETYHLMERKETMPVMYSFHEISGDSVIVYFDGQLSAERASNFTGFEIAGADSVYYPADTQLLEMPFRYCIILKSRNVKKPLNVRYQWTNYAEVNLFGENGIPVPPFRTDNQENKNKNCSGTAIRTTDGKI